MKALHYDSYVDMVKAHTEESGSVSSFNGLSIHIPIRLVIGFRRASKKIFTLYMNFADAEGKKFGIKTRYNTELHKG